MDISMFKKVRNMIVLLDVLSRMQTMATCILENREKLRDNDSVVVAEDGQKNSMFRLLVECETAKVPMLVRVVTKQLNQQNAGKVLIFTNYCHTVDLLIDGLQRFHPLVLQGKLSDEHRRSAIDTFQNDPNRRLLIANITVASTGINLQDIKGDEPRYSYLFPSFRFIDIEQASGRTHRIGMKSDAHIFNVYANVRLDEASILESLQRKTFVLKGLVDDSNVQQFSGDLPNYIESGIRRL